MVCAQVKEIWFVLSLSMQTSLQDLGQVSTFVFQEGFQWLRRLNLSNGVLLRLKMEAAMSSETLVYYHNTNIVS